MSSSTVQSLDDLLDGSDATSDFKQAVGALASGQAPGPRIEWVRGVPPVKALRAIMKLLEDQPKLVVESVAIDAQSGCSDFRGTLTVNGSIRFEFTWDCAWRAEQEGYQDAFGAPDQIRAAQQFGYQCFEHWAKVS